MSKQVQQLALVDCNNFYVSCSDCMKLLVIFSHVFLPS